MPVLVIFLAELAEVIGAFGAYLVVAVLLVWLIGILIWVFQHIPFFGQNVADALQGFANNLHDNAQRDLDQSVQLLTDTIDFISGSIQGLLRFLTNASEWLADQVSKVAVAAVAGIAALQTLAGRLGQALANLATTVVNLGTAATHLAAQVAGIIANTIPAAIARAVAVAEAWATAELTKLRTLVGQAIDNVKLNLEHLVSIESSARTAADATLAHAIDAAEADLERTITGVERGIRDTVTQDVHAIDQQLTGLRDLVGPITAPTVAIAIGEVVTELTRLTRECIDPTCGYLSPQLPLLTALTDAGMLLAMGGLVTEAVQDPQGTARSVVGLVNGIDGLVTGLFGELTGLQV